MQKKISFIIVEYEDHLHIYAISQTRRIYSVRLRTDVQALLIHTLAVTSL